MFKKISLDTIVSAHARLARLNNASFSFFFLGSIAGRIRMLRIPLLNSAADVFSLFFYGIGYLLWLIATCLHPHTTPTGEIWRNFRPFQKQNLLATAFGLVGVCFNFVALIMPVFLIPATWIFFISNILWTASAKHKLETYPRDPLDREYIPLYQEVQTCYAELLTSISFVNAIGTSLIFLFPTLVVPITIASIAVTVVLSLCIVNLFLNYRHRYPDYVEHYFNPEENNSQQLSLELANEPSIPHSYNQMPIVPASSQFAANLSPPQSNPLFVPHFEASENEPNIQLQPG